MPGIKEARLQPQIQKCLIDKIKSAIQFELRIFFVNFVICNIQKNVRFNKISLFSRSRKIGWCNRILFI